MAAAHDTWKVLPHGPIEKLAENLWRVEGSLETMPLKRVMTIAKRTDGALVVHNGVALEESAMKEIDAWGPVRFVVVPNAYHRLDAPAFKRRYPDARVLCPAGARKKVAQVVPVDGTCDDFPRDASVRFERIDGVKDAEAAMVVTSSDGVTVVLNDLVFNMPHVAGGQGWVLRHVMQSTGGPKVTRIGRLFLVNDKRAVRASLERLADLDGLRRIVVSHHETIRDRAPDVLRAVAASL